ncbi:MAG: DUF881 domain-containing protein [Oscillospiraceae bacterium]|nr:DUF881 domain-containing protein [Oscillospiraceae bacterium]
MDMKKLRFQIPIAIVCLALAFALTWQIKGQPRIRALEAPAHISVLVEQYRTVREQNDGLRIQVGQQQEDIDRLRHEVAQNSEGSETMVRQLEVAEMLAGLTDLEGEGVIVTLNDRSGNFDSDFAMHPEWGLIHDDMIFMVINELLVAGAEAISISDDSREERILATSEIRCVGSTVTVNGTRLATPFEIRAIGPAATMDSALRMRGGVMDNITLFGASIDIRMSSNIEIRRFTGAFNLHYARPAGTGGDE